MASRCPEADAVLRCPFLKNVAQTHGESYACSLAAKPMCPAQGSGRQPVLADEDSYAMLFHGPRGVLPLPHMLKPVQEVLYPPPAAPPPVKSERPSLGPLLAAAPLASLSMSWGSNWFNLHHLLQQHLQQHRAHQPKPPQQPQQPSSTPSGGARAPGLGGPGASSLHGASGASIDSGGKCPLRRALGPLAGVVFNKVGQITCPEPIIKMRAALAATRPVRELRPQALPVKLFTVALTAAALNVPCGMWREHTEKFSAQWVLAVHATIPFIAMLRKAVIMPKYAILFTICAAIAGQAIGARLERKRMHADATDELAGLARAKVVLAQSPKPAAATASVASRQHKPLAMASMLLSAQQCAERGAVAVGPSAVQAGGGGAAGFGDTTPPSVWMCGAPQEGVTAAAGALAEQQQYQQLKFSVRARPGRRADAAGALSLVGPRVFSGRCRAAAVTKSGAIAPPVALPVMMMSG